MSTFTRIAGFEIAAYQVTNAEHAAFVTAMHHPVPRKKRVTGPVMTASSECTIPEVIVLVARMRGWLAT